MPLVSCMLASGGGHGWIRAGGGWRRVNGVGKFGCVRRLVGLGGEDQWIHRIVSDLMQWIASKSTDQISFGGRMANQAGLNWSGRKRLNRVSLGRIGSGLFISDWIG